jgi:LPXTG-motif cell wall-anchored protein
VKSLKDGTYTMTETKAPAGYSINTDEWTIEIEGSVPSSVTEKGVIKAGTYANGVVTFFYEDEVLYSLPSAGGTGIFLFVLAGMLLLMGGALLIFAQRRKVLRI